MPTINVAAHKVSFDGVIAEIDLVCISEIAKALDSSQAEDLIKAIQQEMEGFSDKPL